MKVHKRIAGKTQALAFFFGLLLIVLGILTDKWVSGILGIVAILAAYSIEPDYNIQSSKKWSQMNEYEPALEFKRHAKIVAQDNNITQKQAESYLHKMVNKMREKT